MKSLVALAIALALPLAAPAATPSLRLVATIPIPGQAGWDYLALDLAAHRLYMAHAAVAEVIDTRTNRVIASIPAAPGVHGIALAPDLDSGYISVGRTDSVTVFALSTLKARATIKVGGNPDAILYDPATHRVMTFNGRSHDVTVIDARTDLVVATVPVGGRPEFAQLGKSGQAWFNVEDRNELAVLDPATARLVRRVSLAPCRSPTGLGIDARQRLYAVCENKQMVIVTPEGRIAGRAAIGACADAVVMLDGDVYTSNGDDGTISVVRETSPGRFEAIETIPTALGARTVAVDPSTRRFYLSTADLTPAPPGETGDGIDGTLRVLVFEKRGRP